MSVSRYAVRRWPGNKLIMSLLVLLGFAFIAVGCSTELYPVVSVPEVAVPFSLSNTTLGRGAEVAVTDVVDGRGTQTVAEFRGRKVVFGDDIAAPVRRSLETVFRNKGFIVMSGAPVSVELRVRQWNAHVSDVDGVKCETNAQLDIRLSKDGTNRTYTGTYRGMASYQGRSLDNAVLEDLLRTAMSEAVKQLSNDQNLFAVVASF